MRSAIPLPELPAWSGCGDSHPDLTIRLGAVPKRLEPLAEDAPPYQLGQDGRCRFEIPGIAAYLVEADGQTVTVDPVIDPSAPDLRVFLCGPVLSILCHRRGLLPLHASCVRLGGRAVAFTGVAASGKSVLADDTPRTGKASAKSR